MPQDIVGKHVMRILGGGFSHLSIIASVVFVVLCLFYIYSFSTYVGITVYPLIDRITYYSQFDLYIINDLVDHVVIGSLLVLWIMFASIRSKVHYAVIGVFAVLLVAIVIMNYVPGMIAIAISSLPVVIALLVYDKYSQRKILRPQSSELILNYFSLLGIVLGIIGLVSLLTSIFLSTPLSTLPIRNYLNEIFLILTRFSPILLMLLIACIPVKLLLNSIVSMLKGSHDLNLNVDSTLNYLGFRRKLVLLTFIVILSMVVVFIPHLPTINKAGQQVGVDTGAYVSWINTLDQSKTLQDFMTNVFVEQSNGDRPFSIMLLFATHRIVTVDSFHVIEYSPLVLAPSLVIVMYFLTRELTLNDLVPLIAAFVTALSFQILIGVYAGYYANWIALIFGYLSFVFLFRFLRRSRLFDLLLFGALMIIALFSHIYTWSIFTLASGLFLAVLIVRPTDDRIRRNSVLLLVVLLCVVAIDMVRTAELKVYGGIEGDLRLASAFTGIDQFINRWNNLNYAVTIYVGGQFANFVVFGLGIYWLLRANIRGQSSIFVMVFFSIGILPFLIGDYTIQARVFFDIPFQLPAAIALATIAGDSRKSLKSVAIYIWLITIAVTAVSNYYLITPS